MSKFFIVRSRSNNVSSLKVKSVLEKISLEFHVNYSEFENGNHYGFQHHSKNSENLQDIIFGNMIPVKKEYKEDGSYIRIKSDANSLTFYCDTFRSKTAYYFMSDDLFILTNSIKALVYLKGNFKLNRRALSNFLSAGNIGKIEIWDKDAQIVSEKYTYEFFYDKWEIEKRPEKLYLQDEGEVLDDIIVKNIKASLAGINEGEATVPLSGGYDSRLLFNVIRSLNKNITAINWGKSISNNIYCDKRAAVDQSLTLNFKLLDFVLPQKIQNIHSFFENYTMLSDCKLDHFNAFSDDFKIWRYLHQNKIKYIIRGDLPFPTGEYINPLKARQRLDSLNFIDYSNLDEFKLDQLIQQQDENLEYNAKYDESKIAWRDRLYRDFRLPTAISFFYDMTNSYTDTILPLMSYRLLLYYNKLDDKGKFDKKFIKDFSKKIDSSNVSFNSVPSIPSQLELVEQEIPFLISYLKNNASREIYSQNLLESVVEKLEKIPRTNPKINDSHFKNSLKKMVPRRLKYLLKSKQKISLNSLQISYRIVMSDIYIKSLYY